MKTTWVILAALLTALLAQPGAAPAQRPERVIEVMHAATAEVVFAQGGQNGTLTGAELAYGDMRLVAELIEFDSQSEVVELSGNVRLTSPEMELNAPQCRAELASGIIRVEKGFTLVHKVQRVNAKADSGTVMLEAETMEPYSAELVGNVQARWEEGLQLDGKRLQYDFAERLCALTDGFIALIDAGLLTESFAEVAGGGLTIVGTRAFVKEEGDAPRRLLFTASEVQVNSQRLSIAGPNLATNLMVANGDGEGLEQALFMISGVPGMPVSGWLLANTGECVNFSALSLTKMMGSTELQLSGSVEISGNDFSLKAEKVVAWPEGDGVRIEVPQRFRVEMTPELFQREESEGEPQPTG